MGREIIKTHIQDCIVSTVELGGAAQRWMFGVRPTPYETMIFGGKNHHYGIQHVTEKEAVIHHKKVLVCIRAGIDPDTLDA